MRRKKMLRWLMVPMVMLIVVALVIGGCAPTPALEAMTLLVNAGPLGGQDSMSKTMVWFGDQITERSGGLIKFEYIWSFGITKPAEEIDALQGGMSHLAGLVQGYYPSKLYLDNFSKAIPFGIPDTRVAQQISETIYYEEKLIDEQYEPLGMKYLFGEWAASYSMVSTKPVTKLEDFKGMKIAVTGAEPSKWLEAVGAVPMSLTLVDRVSALQTGMLDGSILPTDLSFVFKEHEFAPYWMTPEWGAWNNYAYVIDLELFNSFPKDTQKMFMEVAREGDRRYTETFLAATESILGKMRESGVTISPGLSYEDKAEWSDRIVEHLGESVAAWIAEGETRGYSAKKVVKKWVELQKAAGYKFTREWALD